MQLSSTYIALNRANFGLTAEEIARVDQLLRAQNQEDYPYQEIKRCPYEVEVATIIRACYPKWQVRELLVDFSHNHFNVNIDADNAIRAGGQNVS